MELNQHHWTRRYRFPGLFVAQPLKEQILGTQGSTLEAAKNFDIEGAFSALHGDETTHEVRASSLIRYIQTTLKFSFERARDVLNVLVDMGRAVWTNFSVVRVVFP